MGTLTMYETVDVGVFQTPPTPFRQNLVLVRQHREPRFDAASEPALSVYFQLTKPLVLPNNIHTFFNMWKDCITDESM
jgi:hypothetical protein